MPYKLQLDFNLEVDFGFPQMFEWSVRTVASNVVIKGFGSKGSRFGPSPFGSIRFIIHRHTDQLVLQLTHVVTQVYI